MTNSNPNFNPNIDETDSAESNISPIEQLTEDNKQNKILPSKKNFLMFLFMVVEQVFTNNLCQVIHYLLDFLLLQCIMFQKDHA